MAVGRYPITALRFESRKSYQLLVRTLELGCEERCPGIPSGSADEPSTSAEKPSSKAGIWSLKTNSGASVPLSLLRSGLPGCMRSSPILPTLPAGGPTGLYISGGISHVRHLSWRRLIPSTGDLRSIFEGSTRQVTNLLIALNVATYLMTKVDRGVAVSMAGIPYAIARGEWHRLLTCGFLHTDFLHLLSNSLFLHWIGADLEASTGRTRFVTVYLVSVLGGSWAQYQFGAANAVFFGASGGAMGVFAAYLVYRLRNRSFIPWSPDDTSWLAQVVGLNVMIMLLAGGSIAHLAHLGGAVAGASTCWLIGPRYRWSRGGVEDQPLLPLFRRRR